MTTIVKITYQESTEDNSYSILHKHFNLKHYIILLNIILLKLFFIVLYLCAK